MGSIYKIIAFFLVVFAIFSYSIINEDIKTAKKINSSAQNLALCICKKKGKKKNLKNFKLFYTQK